MMINGAMKFHPIFGTPIAILNTGTHMSYRERVMRRRLETVGALIAPGLEMSPWAAQYWTQVYRQLTLADGQPDPTPIDTRPDPD
jgi:hypothetical protein